MLLTGKATVFNFHLQGSIYIVVGAHAQNKYELLNP